MDSYNPQNPPLPAYRLRIRIWIILWFLYIYMHYLLIDGYASFLYGINIFIHEAGHIILAPLGDFIHALGGTIFQIGIPLAWLIYWRNSNIASQFALFWIGENLLEISVYAGDAINLQLPLLFPNGIHDWSYMFGELGILQYTPIIAKSIFTLWSLCILWSIILLARDAKNRASIEIWLNQY